MDQHQEKQGAKSCINHIGKNNPCMSSTSATITPVVVPTTSIIERGKRIKLAAEIGLIHSSGKRHWGRALRRRLLRKRTTITSITNGCGSCKLEAKKGILKFSCKKEDEEEEVVVEKKVRALQRLVPGGETLEVEKLFEETADYVKALEEQVRVMRVLASFLGQF